MDHLKDFRNKITPIKSKLKKFLLFSKKPIVLLILGPIVLKTMGISKILELFCEKLKDAIEFHRWVKNLSFSA